MVNLNARKRSDWLTAIITGIAVCLLALVLLPRILIFFIPGILGAHGVTNVMYGLAVWGIAVALGVWQALRTRGGT